MKVNVNEAGEIVIADFSSSQAFKIAIRMEKDGIAFYRDLQGKVKDQETMREISFLIQQEQEHLKTFQARLEEEKALVDDDFEEDDIVSFINSKVFDPGLEGACARAMDHRHTALEEAMAMERRSMAFYEGCYKNASAQEAKDAFEKIWREEKSHLKKFGELLRTKCINSDKGCIL